MINRPIFVAKVVLFALLLYACNISFPITVSTPIPTILSQTSTPDITTTPLYTPTVEPTPTMEPSATDIPTPEIFVLENTPLPDNFPIIYQANAFHISTLTEYTEPAAINIKWTSDQRYLAAGIPTGIVLYDRFTNSRFRLINTGEGLTSFDFSPNSQWLITGHRVDNPINGSRGIVQKWVAPDFPLMGVYSDIREVSSIIYVPNGNRIAIAYTSPDASQNSVEFRELYSWELFNAFKTGSVLDIAISPNGDLLATAPDRYAIKLWDINDGSLLATFYTSFTGAVNCLTFSPDGNKLATGHYDGTIQIWDTENRTILQTITTPGVVESLAFSLDGSLLAAGLSYESNLIQLWLLSTNQLLIQLHGHQRAVEQLAFSPDGSILASSSYDGTVRLWGVRP